MTDNQPPTNPDDPAVPDDPTVADDQVLPDVSVIIVSWNVRDLVRDCIRSVIDRTNRTHEIIVVDNASSDGSAGVAAAGATTGRCWAGGTYRDLAGRGSACGTEG